jgi:hypothetical protein
MIVEGVRICKIPALGWSANLPFWVEAPLAVAAARHGVRWQHEGWCPGIPEEEVRWRIGGKRTEEVPLATGSSTTLEKCGAVYFPPRRPGVSHEDGVRHSLVRAVERVREQEEGSNRIERSRLYVSMRRQWHVL